MLLVRIAVRKAVDFLSQLAEYFPHLVFLQTALSRAHIDVANPVDHSGLQFGSFLSNLRKEHPVLETNVGADQTRGESRAGNQNLKWD
jgi:hypothetical protein